MPEKFNVFVGKEVWILPDENAARRSPGGRRGVVTKIGRTYFYVGMTPTDAYPLKFRLKDMTHSDDDYGSSYHLFETEEKLRTYLEAKRKLLSIRHIFSSFSEKFSEEEIFAVYDILEQNGHPVW